MNKYFNVTDLGHSARKVETSGHYFLFDCQDENEIDLEEFKDKPLFIFFSHFHHDHYSKKLHKKSTETGVGFTVLGDFASRIENTANTVTMRPREEKTFEDITVRTADSSDAGVCYLIQADGLNIFFAGDHADWADGDPKNSVYYNEIDYLAELCREHDIKIDLAFIPVCTFSGTRPEALTKGAIYAVKTFSPSVTYPIHANGRFRLYREFEKDLRAAGWDGEVVYES